MTGNRWLTAGLLLACLALAACGSQDKRQAEQENARKAAETNTALGRQYMDRGQYEIALDKLKRAIAHDNTYAPAHTLLGVLYETLGETDQAGEEYALAVKFDPTDGDVNNNYGVYLCGRGKTRQAEQHFQTAVEDPFYTTPQVAFTNAGVCALEAGDLDKAETYLRQSLDIDSNSGAALLPMANISYRHGDYLRARAFLQRFEANAELDEESLQLGYLIETELGDARAASHYRETLMQRFPASEEAARARNRD